MANMAECAIAIAKEDLHLLNGAIRKATEEDSQWETRGVRRFVSANDDSIYRLVERRRMLQPEEGEHFGKYKTEYKLRKDREVLKLTEDIIVIGNMIEQMGLKPDTNYHCGQMNNTYDAFSDNGWFVDWKKLHGYSYEMDASITDKDDHITIYFGGRWSFPDDLENYLNRSGVRWHGACVEDGCNVRENYLGNTDFSLVIEEEENDDGDQKYIQHYIYDAS